MAYSLQTELIESKGASLLGDAGCMRWIVRRSLVLVAFAAFFLTSALSQAQATQVTEDQLKAAFIYNFTKFVEWPKNSFPDAKSPLVIGVMGNSLFAAEVESAVKDRHVNGRGFVVQRVKSPESAQGLHLLFVEAEQATHFDEMKEILKRNSVLTIGESDLFGKHGGIINFRFDGDKLRFEINLHSADEAGLKMNAQLLKLAMTVRRE